MVLIFKLLLGIAGAIAVTPAVAYGTRLRVTTYAFDVWSLAVLVALRMTVFIVIFFILKFPPTSDVGVYWTEGNQVLSGMVPMVNIQTAYGFLFDYIIAILLKVWNNAVIIVLFSVLIELMSYPIWLRVARCGFNEETVRCAAVLYIFNPLAVSTVVIAGQNHVWISLFLAFALLSAAKGKTAESGVALGFSVVAVKFISLLFAPVLFFISQRKRLWMAAFLLPIVLGYAVPIAVGARPWSQVTFHALYESSGSIPYLLSGVGFDLSAPRARITADAVGFLALCIAFVTAVWRLGRLTFGRAVLLCGFILVITLLVQKKSFTTYLIITLFPLCLAVAMQERRRIAVLFMQGLSALATLEPSLWFRWMRQGDLDLLWRSELPEGMSRLQVTGFALCEAVLIFGYVVLLAMIWRAMSRRVT